MNISVNTSDEQAIAEIFKNYPETLLHFACACCVIFIVLGIPGNLTTIIALATYKRFRNWTAILIINLHISNLMFCCTALPLAAVSYSERGWILIFSKTTCSVYALMKFSLIATAHFCVVAITINRYIMVCHPFRYSSFHKKKYLISLLVGSWIAGFGLFMPSFFELWGRFDLIPSEGTCTMIPTKNGSPKIFIVFFAFAGPYLVMCFCYFRIWWILRKSTQRRNGYNAKNLENTIETTGSEPLTVPASPTASASSPDDLLKLTNSDALLEGEQESTANIPFKTFFKSFRTSFKINLNQSSYLPTKKDKKLATMIIALLISFTICHLPLMVMRASYGNYKSNSVANILAHLLEYSSACISPVVYVIMSNEYRHTYKRFFDNMQTKIKNTFTR